MPLDHRQRPEHVAALVPVAPGVGGFPIAKAVDLEVIGEAEIALHRFEFGTPFQPLGDDVVDLHLPEAYRLPAEPADLTVNGEDGVPFGPVEGVRGHPSVEGGTLPQRSSTFLTAAF